MNEDTFFVPRDNSKQREADIPMVKRKWGLLKAEDKQVKFLLHYKLTSAKPSNKNPTKNLADLRSSGRETTIVATASDWIFYNVCNCKLNSSWIFWMVKNLNSTCHNLVQWKLILSIHHPKPWGLIKYLLLDIAQLKLDSNHQMHKLSGGH